MSGLVRRMVRVGLSIVFITLTLYLFTLTALIHPTLQRHALYLHKARSPSWWHDPNTPEEFGFATKQVTPFNLNTSDGETLYAWHVLPTALYAKNRDALMNEGKFIPTGQIAEDIKTTKAFELLKNDPESRLVINFHGNAGTVVQGWRTHTYQALYAANPSKIHIFAIDYRGFGKSTGFPTQDGLIIDGIAAVNWAMEVAMIPADRIVIVGQSLGTAVAAGVAEHFAKGHVEFAGVVLVAAFTDLPHLLTDYKISGYIPLLSPLKRFRVLQDLFKIFVVDKWPTITRLANFIRVSKRPRLYLLHAIDDADIPWKHSEALLGAARDTLNGSPGLIYRETSFPDGKSSARSVALKGWDGKVEKYVSLELTTYGGHNRIMTSSIVTLAVYRAFYGPDEENFWVNMGPEEKVDEKVASKDEL